MPAWLVSLLTGLLSRIVTWLLGKWIEKEAREKKVEETNRKIDEKLAKLKETIHEAYNGEPVTEDQKKRLQEAFRDFIRPTDPRGL